MNPFIEPDNQQDTFHLIQFLTDTALTYSTLSESSDDLRPKALTLWAMQEFHIVHAWAAEQDYLELPDEQTEEHRDKAREYHDVLSDFFQNNTRAVEAFQTQTASEMSDAFQSSDP